MGNVRTIPAERSDKAPFAAARPADPRAPEQHSIGRSVVLHLLPGALITLFFALTAPVARGLGCCASSPTASRRLRSSHDLRDLVARLAEESFPRQLIWSLPAISTSCKRESTGHRSTGI